MTDFDAQRMFYDIICSPEEVDRIMNVQNGKDYLLKLRADTVLDHMRLQRVFMNRRRMHTKGDWSFENSFNGYHFIHFKNKLNPELRSKCEQVTYGNIYSTSPNGLIFPTEYGPVTTICDSLRFFLKFMHLGLFSFKTVVPIHVRFNSILIAIRVMLKTEALDFLMDPRGIIPSDVGERIHQPIPFQLQFIAGHEYSHFLLDHFDENKLTDNCILRAISNGDDYGNIKVYSTSQKNEFEADLASIDLPDYSEEERFRVAEAGLLWYACLDVYESIEEFMFPPIGQRSHPTARERFFNILDNSKINQSFDKKYWIDNVLPEVDQLREFLVKDASLNIENYETYGSIYLDKPDTEWRGKELIDRKDYY